MNNRSITVNQGKALGGSSAINAQIFAPPTKANSNSWETLGNEGWDWNALQKNMTKAYTYPPVEAGLEAALDVDGWAAKNDAAKGPIQTSFPKVAVHEAWANTMKGLGYPMAHDPFLGAASGSFSVLHSVDPITKERSYSASAYYQPHKDRENLVVLTGAHVDKILFDREGRVKASGVQYTHNGTTQTASVTKEVVLAAGTFQSPKILELSGIGDAKLLSKHGIDPVWDLPGVGENLQDHLACGIAYEAVDSLETLDALARQEPEAIGQALQEYATSQSGPLTSIGIETYAYLPIADSASQDSPVYKKLSKLLDDNRPPESDHRASALHSLVRQTLLDPKAPSGVHMTMRTQNPHPVDLAWSPESPAGPVPGKFLTLATVLSHPLSLGTTHIRSGDPTDNPVIDPAYLSNPVDAEVFASHILQIEQIAASEPLSSTFLKQPLRRRDPASDFKGDLGRAERFARTCSISMWHPAGTCAMLPLDKRGVVDSALRVHGVQGVRVVDASVMPLISNANLQAVVYGIAERAADLIKATWAT
ncbi:putative glucose-methanol-choline oxidoreductase [Diaporthe ampelina]|uniref:Putative glucose-methanol-choline oxidoreductase n=1 Tax=Diaporthe ampelina TaxID=1214573 RepID=A0A0G2F5D4_9PEZI|nr:putative glucose-methanol-choline oxidoreductase [Diaporthe ampelina]